MIEVASSWVLPENSTYRREPARPAHLRQANFETEFDACTVFYDCFRLTNTQAMLIGPPLVSFAGVLDSLTITSPSTGSQCQYHVDHQFTTAFVNRRTHNLCRVVVDVPRSEATLHLQSKAGNTTLEIRPNSSKLFHGKRVLFTLSRNNHPAWICDWMRFHRDLQSADGVLLYDNDSTAYSVESLAAAMNQVSGFDVIRVVKWPYKYGPQGIGRGTWDSSFSQDGAMEDARWRFLADAHAVLNCDIDELVLSTRENVFDRAAGSPSGYIKFSGRWVNSNRDRGQAEPRHRESAYQLPPRWRWKGVRPKDLNLCPTKWAVVPNRCPAKAHWSVHEIVGMRAQKLKLSETCYRHFRQISTNWKNRRTEIRVSDRMLQKDVKLLEAFASVKWND